MVQTTSSNTVRDDPAIVGTSGTIANTLDAMGGFVGAAGGTGNDLTIVPARPTSAYVFGQTYGFVASAPNTGAGTLSVSGLASAPLIRGDGTPLQTGDLLTGITYTALYTSAGFLLSGPAIVQVQATAAADSAGNSAASATQSAGSASAAAISALNAQTGVPNRDSIRAVQGTITAGKFVGSNLAATYSNGTAGVGATLTATATGVFTAADGQALVVGDAILFPAQTDPTQNGIFLMTTAGASGVSAVFTRRSTGLTPENVPSGLQLSCWLVTGGTLAGYAFYSAAASITIGTTQIPIVPSSNTSGVAGEATARIASDAVHDKRLSSLDSAARTSIVLGAPTPVTGTQVAANTFCFEPRLYDGVLEQVQLFDMAAGNIRIKRFTLSGSTLTYVAGSTTGDIAVSAGSYLIDLKVLIGGYKYYAGDCLAFYFGTGRVAYLVVTSSSLPYSTVGGDNITTFAHAVVSNIQLQMALICDEYQPLPVATAAVQAAVTAETTRALGVEMVLGNAPSQLARLSLPGAFCAGGTLRLNPKYTGPIVRLRRSTDSVLQDFYCAVGSDELDVAAVTTWLAGGTAFVYMVYGQFAAHNMTMTSNGSQATLVISGSKSWVAFVPGKQLLFGADAYSLGQYRDGITMAMCGMIDPAVTQSGYLFSVTKGTSNGAARGAFWFDNAAHGIEGFGTAFDDEVSITTPAIATATAWFGAVLSCDYRAGIITLRAGVKTTSQTIFRTGRSSDTAALQMRINGLGGGTGSTWNCRAVIAYNDPLNTSDLAALKLAVEQFAPDFVRETSATQVEIYGDSQGEGSVVTDQAQRPAPFMASLFQTVNGKYRVVRDYAYAGWTSTQVKNLVLSKTFVAGQPVYIQAGVNDQVITGESVQVVSRANLQAVYDRITSFGANPIFGTLSPEESWITGTTQRINLDTFSSWILSNFPNNSLDTKQVLLDAYSLLANPTAQDIANHANNVTARSYCGDPGPTFLHRNALGTAIEYGAVHDFIVSKGW